HRRERGGHRRCRARRRLLGLVRNGDPRRRALHSHRRADEHPGQPHAARDAGNASRAHRRRGDNRSRGSGARVHGRAAGADRNRLARARRRCDRRAGAGRRGRSGPGGNAGSVAHAGGRCPRARQTAAYSGRDRKAGCVVDALHGIQGNVPERTRMKDESRPSHSFFILRPSSFGTMRTFAGTLRLADVGKPAALAGWVQKQRDFGDLLFIDLRDRSGICQVVVDKARGAGEALLSAAKECRSEFVVRVEGEVIARTEESRNPKLPTGEVELLARSLEILNTAETPPFAIEENVEAAEELRLKYRYLDLRRPSL